MPNRLLFLFLLCCMLTAALPPEVAAQSGFVTDRSRARTDIPFEYINHFIVITAYYGGIFPLRFVFDTGAEHTILTHKEVPMLLNARFDRTFSVLGADMKTELTAYLLRGIRLVIPELAEAPAMDLLVLEDDYFQFDRLVGEPIHGILAAQAFSKYIIIINYERRVITLIRRGEEHRYLSDFESQPISIYRNKPYLDTKIAIDAQGEEVPVRLLLDSGAGLSLLLYPSTHERLSPPPTAIKGEIARGLGGKLEGWAGRTSKMSLSSTLFQENVVTHFQLLDTTDRSGFLNQRNGIIGNGMMERFFVGLDFQQGKLYLKPNRGYKKAYLYDRSGLSLIASGPNLRDYVVLYVSPGSPAAEAGIQKGDEILRLNLQSSQIISYAALIRKLQGKQGKRVALKIRRNGRTFIARFELRDLF